MLEGTPTYDQLCHIIGKIYVDAYLRIQSLENENKQLREDQHKHVESLLSSIKLIKAENDELKRGVDRCYNTSGNIMSPESLRVESQSK